MRKVDELFKATAASLWETMTSHAGTAGFRIPEYQRSYNWNLEKISRLLEDSANGLYYLSEHDESFTFLGTLILVSEKHKETTFDGSSLAIVDGQQRLTTLVLTLCALIEAMNDEMHTLEHLPSVQKQWLFQEANFQLEELYGCVVGQLRGRGRTFSYPRLIRSEDARARETKDTEYRSIISRFLREFSRYYEEERTLFEFPQLSDQSADVKLFRSNFEFIRDQVRFIASPEGKENVLGCETITSEHFSRRGIRRLFDKLDTYQSDRDRDRTLSILGKGTEANAIVRLVLFASYLMRCVVLTRVETDDESSAFDIFDALNTTGEPLTAVETLKPRVIQYETQAGNGYRGSESEQAFERIDAYLDQRFASPDERQKETKELIVSYALYVDGTKQPKDLSSQRRYLRSCFEKIEREAGIDLARRFVAGLGDLAKFRQQFWDREGIRSMAGLQPGPVAEEVQLCNGFLRDMNTSLVIPPLARYWWKLTQDGNQDEYLTAVRALTAFVVLRRAATGSTANIDADLRALMGKSVDQHGDPLCVGLTNTHRLATVSEFKAALRRKLAVKSIGVVDEDSWVRRTRENPLAQQSRPITRFLLLAAAEQSQPDKVRPGLWSRSDVTRTDERSYLTFRCWIDEKYSTVEHVAPASKPMHGWDDAIYLRPYTRHTLGNLVLLPQEENSLVGNASWSKKKMFYLALMEKEKSQKDAYVKLAKAEGIPFSRKIQKVLESGERLHLLDALYEVEDWDGELVEARTENICRLAWKTISPWLYA